MPSFNFETGPNYYGYADGVNAANLTKNDIDAANARLSPTRLQRIQAGLLKATRDDPGYSAQTPATKNGFCDYDKWSKRELLDAMISRGLKLKTARVDDLTKPAMIAKLKKANQASRFTRFLELSAELRNEIYNLAMPETPRVRPAPPSISQTNRQIRSETLPIFFRNTTMVIHVEQETRPVMLANISAPLRSMKLSSGYREYFNYATTTGWVKFMRRFKWYVTGCTLASTGLIKKSWTVKSLITFANAMDSVEVSGESNTPAKFARDQNSLARARIHDEQLRQVALIDLYDKMVKITKKKEKTMTYGSFETMLAFFVGSDQTVIKNWFPNA